MTDGSLDEDPTDGPWYADVNGENGDICAWKTRSLGQHVAQQEWSNQANTCV